MSIYFYMNDDSRSAIKSDVTLLARECTIIYELDSLEDNSTFICTELCLSDSNFISKLHLYKVLYNLDVIFLCYDVSKAELVSDYARVFICDYSIVDMDMIRSAIYRENEGTPVSDDLEIESILNKKTSSDTERTLAKLLLQEREVNKSLASKTDDLRRQCNILRETSARENSILDKMTKYYNKVVAKSIELESSLQQYKAILAEDVYEKVNAFKYKDRPQVVYLKQYQYALGVYELLNVLYNALYYQKHKSVKVVQLLDSSGSMRLKEIPDYYKVFINSFNRNDMYRNDFICCVGPYQKLLGALLENTSKTDILIIYDTLSHEDIVMQNAMLQYGICRTGEVARSFALGENTIVNEGAEKFIEYKPLNTIEDTFVHNASSDIILRLINDIEDFSSTIQQEVV